MCPTNRTVTSSQQVASTFLRCLWTLTIQTKKARQTCYGCLLSQFVWGLKIWPKSVAFITQCRHSLPSSSDPSKPRPSFPGQGSCRSPGRTWRGAAWVSICLHQRQADWDSLPLSTDFLLMKCPWIHWVGNAEHVLGKTQCCLTETSCCHSSRGS